MCQPRREPVTGIVPHRALRGRVSERIGNALCRAFVIGREGNANVAIIEDGVVLAISLLDLVEALRDQEGAHAVAGQERKAGFEEIQPAERRELVEHHEQLMPGSGIGAVLRMEMLGRSEEHTSELQSLMRISYAVF